MFARDVITDVLAEKVSRNYFDEDDAIEVALKILRENAIELCDLRGKGYV